MAGCLYRLFASPLSADMQSADIATQAKAAPQQQPNSSNSPVKQRKELDTRKSTATPTTSTATNPPPMPPLPLLRS